MKLRIIALLSCVLFFNPIFADDAIKTMASVLVNLNHFPSDTDKQALTKIVNDASSSDVHKTLAGILKTMAHQPSEADSMIFRRSIYAVKDIAKGERLDPASVRSIRPGFGLPPKELPRVLGARAARDIPRGTPIDWSLIHRDDREGQ